MVPEVSFGVVCALSKVVIPGEAFLQRNLIPPVRIRDKGYVRWVSQGTYPTDKTGDSLRLYLWTSACK